MDQTYVGEITHGQTGTRLYICWKNMKSRCYNEKSDRYPTYGAKGITICEEWFKFENFYTWSINNGYSDDLTIDRIDPLDNYRPDNCRWVSKSENHNEMMTFHLKTKTGIFSSESSEKSRLTNRTAFGKKTYCRIGDDVLEFGSRGELIDFIVKSSGRKRESVKSHVNQCLKGKSLTCNGYEIYE